MLFYAIPNDTGQYYPLRCPSDPQYKVSRATYHHYATIRIRRFWFKPTNAQDSHHIQHGK